MPSRKNPALLVLRLTLIVVVGAATCASACPVCVGLPDKTAADYLIESRCVLLARPDAANPFAYVPHEVLKGRYDGSPIDLLVNSVTRQRLKSEPGRGVILVQGNAGGESDAGGDWRSLGVASPDFEAVARRILLFAPSWTRAGGQNAGGKNPEGPSERIRFFASLFGHEERKIRELAYLELGRAPYSFVKRIARSAPRQDFADMLEDRRYLEWRSLAILLLAQSDDPQDKQRIVQSFRLAHRFGMTSNLAAWAVAAVEIQGETAIRFIEDGYFRSSDRSAEERREVLSALSMLGSEADQDLQNRIVKSYGVLIEHVPAFAASVAKELEAWNRSEFTQALSKILHDNSQLDASERQTIRNYLNAAEALKEMALVKD